MGWTSSTSPFTRLCPSGPVPHLPPTRLNAPSTFLRFPRIVAVQGPLLRLHDAKITTTKSVRQSLSFDSLLHSCTKETKTTTTTTMSAEKVQVPSPSVLAPYIDAVHNLVHPVSGPIVNTANNFHGWKERMGLVQPGTVEGLTKEISRESST